MSIPTNLITKWYSGQMKSLFPLAVLAESNLSTKYSTQHPFSKTQTLLIPHHVRAYLWRFNGRRALNESPIYLPRPYRGIYWANKKKYFPIRYLRIFAFFSTYFNVSGGARPVSGRRFTRRARFARVTRSWGFNFWPHEAAIVSTYTPRVSRGSAGTAASWYLANFSSLVFKTLWCRSLTLVKKQLQSYARWMEIRKQVLKALCFVAVKVKSGQKWRKVGNLAGLLSWTHLGTKSQWGLRNAKFKYAKKNMYVYLRYLKAFWQIARTRSLTRVLTAKVFSSTVYRHTNFKKYFGLRLESFLVSSFRVKTLQHARALIKNGHVFVNGVRVVNEGVSLKRLDVITFSTRALVWLRLLRRIRRNRKTRKFDRRITARKGSAAVIYGPRGSHAVIWNLSAAVRDLSKCRQLPVFSENSQKHLSQTLRTLSR